MAFKLKEIVYDIREKLKVLMSDDTNITDEYLIHLINVKRAFLLKQKYSDIRRYIPDSVKQLICVDLAPTAKIGDFECAGKVLRSTTTIPELINFNGIIGITKVSSLDFTSVPFNYISMDRFPYVGYNRWLARQVYVTIGADMYLYIKAADPQHMMLRHVKISGMFSNPEEIQGLNCIEEDACEDMLDIEYPIEDSLVSPLVQMIIQELIPTLSIAGDNNNNAKEATLNETREV